VTDPVSSGLRPFFSSKLNPREAIAGACRPYPKDACVPQLVAAQANVTPNANALVKKGQGLTYRQLDTLANQLAHYLRLLKVCPEVPVGVCLERSPALVAAELGILKAGGAFMPLDPDAPPDRWAFMLNDAAVPVVVCERKIAEKLPGGRWQVVALDADNPQILHQSQEPPDIEIKPQHLAYVLYTSGSTGQPKGVSVTHDSLLNLVYWHRRKFAVTSSDRASQLAGLGFDAVVWEIWPYLTAGASVHFPDEAIRVIPEALRDWLVAERITISFVPTPLAERIIRVEWPPETSLRFLLTGGDTLHRRSAPGCPFILVNNYGPTECTVVATSGVVAPSQDSQQLPPIGTPIDNTQVYILDEQLRQLPIGVPGELFVGGVALARGYLNSPQLTAERFIPNPFSSEPGARLYKTGDLAVLLPDGQIGFLGRTDEQIKIRGYRIEPHEIVAQLEKHPGVRACAVVARQIDTHDKVLVAYIVSACSTSEPPADELREFVRGRLPHCFVPSIFVRLESLPLTANGKLDRSALPTPNEDNMLREEVFLAPRTGCEKRLAAIVAELLRISQVGLHDNFFLLGGHSLLGVQLISRVRDNFGVELSLRTLFENPTVIGISQEIEHLKLKHPEGGDCWVQQPLSDGATTRRAR